MAPFRCGVEIGRRLYVLVHGAKNFIGLRGHFAQAMDKQPRLRQDKEKKRHFHFEQQTGHRASDGLFGLLLYKGIFCSQIIRADISAFMTAYYPILCFPVITEGIIPTRLLLQFQIL